MQHPEEGTIHSWLDGQLPLTQAAEIESHVAACPTCGAAVAEARGFIAASSRILTALDDAPRGVIPVAAPGSGNRRAMLRAAAAVFVVAAGSFVVLGRTGRDGSQFDSVATKVTVPVTANESTVNESGVAAITAPTVSRAEMPPAGRDRMSEPIVHGGTSAGRPSASDAASAPPRVAATTAAKSPADMVAQRSARLEQPPPVMKRASPEVAENSVPLPDPAPAIAGPHRITLRGRQQEPDAAPASPEPRLARTDSAGGVRRSVYEVGAGQTVTLTESPAESVQLSAVVTTGVATEPAAQSAPRMERARTGAARQAPVGGTAAGAALAPAPPTAAMTMNSVSWVEFSTGKRFTLMGPFTVEELRAIRVRLDALKTQNSKKAP